MRRVGAPLTPLELSFVAGRSGVPRHAAEVEVVQVQRDFTETQAWKDIVSTQPLAPTIRRDKPKQTSMFQTVKRSEEPRVPSIVVSPILVPKPTQLETQFTTWWNATNFRRAIAASCFRLRAAKAQRHLSADSIRNCFVQPDQGADEQSALWNKLLGLTYDMWHHVEQHASPSLVRNMHMSFELVQRDRESRNVLQGVDFADASLMLTSIKAFLSEFSDVVETEWTQERIVKHLTRAKDDVVTTYVSKEGSLHYKERVEETIECLGPHDKGFHMNVAVREPATKEELPLITLPTQVEISQYKVFTWSDSSYAHTIQVNKQTRWKLVFRLGWRGDSMLEADAFVASRRNPRVTISVETESIPNIVQSSMAPEMTLTACAGVYAMSAMTMIPRERDQWTWKLL